MLSRTLVFLVALVRAASRHVLENGGASPASAAWFVGPGALWLRPPGGEPLDLARYGSLRRVLDALVTRRLEAPGVAWSPVALLEAGWPGDRVGHESGMMRVYSVIRRLRALGLGGAIVTRDDGYLIDPEVAMVRVAASASPGDSDSDADAVINHDRSPRRETLRAAARTPTGRRAWLPRARRCSRRGPGDSCR